MWTRSIVLLICLTGPAAAAAAAADNPYKRPKPKSDLDLLMAAPDGAPTTRPATRDRKPPANPFNRSNISREDAMPGVVHLSDGRFYPGHIYTTLDRPFKVRVGGTADSGKFRHIPSEIVESIDAVVVWERQDDDWRWKDEGSDVKVFTGKKYPNRKTDYKFTLIDGQTITGGISVPIYIELGGKKRRFILHEREKGKLGTTLEQLVYVKRVVYSEEKMTEALKKFARSRPATRKSARKKGPATKRRPSTRRTARRR